MYLVRLSRSIKISEIVILMSSSPNGIASWKQTHFWCVLVLRCLVYVWACYEVNFFWTELFCRYNGRYWCPGCRWLHHSWSGKQIRGSDSFPSVRKQSRAEWKSFPSWKIHHGSPEGSYGRAQVRPQFQTRDVRETHLNLALVQTLFYRFP